MGTVGWTPPFARTKLGHSRRWLCTSLENGHRCQHVVGAAKRISRWQRLSRNRKAPKFNTSKKYGGHSSEWFKDAELRSPRREIPTVEARSIFLRETATSACCLQEHVPFEAPTNSEEEILIPP